MLPPEVTLRIYLPAKHMEAPPSKSTAVASSARLVEVMLLTASRTVMRKISSLSRSSGTYATKSIRPVRRVLTSGELLLHKRRELKIHRGDSRSLMDTIS